MATKIPLVLGADGLPQQLQAGDQISSPTTAPTLRSVTNSDSVSLPLGTPIYTTAADAVKRGQANAKATSRIIGLVFDPSIAAAAIGTVATGGTIVGTTTQWDAVAGTTGGLTFNTDYFLDPATAGKLTATPPTTVGQVNALIGRALSTTEFELVSNVLPILL